MGSQDGLLFEQLKNLAFSTESAVVGEGAGIAMGLVAIGSATGEYIQEMLAFAHANQHEKIIRNPSPSLNSSNYFLPSSSLT